MNVITPNAPQAQVLHQTVWQRAAAERNWLVFAITHPDPNTGKTGKYPTDQISSEYVSERRDWGSPVSVMDAARYTLGELQELMPTLKPTGDIMRFSYGYLPSPGSTLTVADLDDCRDPETGVIEPWADEIVALTPTYAEISTSLTGIRMLMVREEGDDQFSSGERHGAGFFANGGRGAALTFNHLSGAFVEPVAAPSVRDAIMARKGADSGPREASGYEGRAVEPDFLRDVVMAIPNMGLGYDDWVAVGHVIKLQDDTERGRDLFIEWSERYLLPHKKGTPTPAKMWERGLKPNGQKGFGSLVRMARNANGGERMAGDLEGRMVMEMAFSSGMPREAPVMAYSMPSGIPVPSDPVELGAIAASDLFGVSIPQRVWHVAGMIPSGTVTMLGGDGGTGKSLAALQLAVATALGRKWLGQETREAKSLYLSAEDDMDELHRRLADIVTAENVGLPDLKHMRIASLAGKDALLAHMSASGALSPTPLLDNIRAEMDMHRPGVVVLDTLADLFPGNENDRAQARQFISILRGLAIEYSCAVLLLSHPSLSGMASGAGTSGSTAWSNSVRSRLYLSRIKEDSEGYESDPDLRTLETMKSNYGGIGDKLTLRWKAGVFLTGPQMGLMTTDESQLRAENVFMGILAKYEKEDRCASFRIGSNYAPKLFPDHPDANGLKKRAFKMAMERLLNAGRIKEIQTGPPSKRINKLQITGA